MSDDLVNQLTLNFLISKNQLQRLNKKMKEDKSELIKNDKEIYGDRIKILFNNLLTNNSPDDLLYDVKSSFDLFLDKCIYYLKAHDNNEDLERERVETDTYIHDDIDFEKEERQIEQGNYKENSEGEEEGEEEEESEDDDEGEEEDIILNNQSQSNIFLRVKPKYTNNALSTGVEDIQKLPLDWFQNIRQNYKKNQIIPRKKEVIIGEQSFSKEKRKYK